MNTHNICFHGEIRKILCGYRLLSVAMLCYNEPSNKEVPVYDVSLSIMIASFKLQFIIILPIFIKTFPTSQKMAPKITP